MYVRCETLIATLVEMSKVIVHIVHEKAFKKKNLIIIEKPNLKNGGAGSSARASPFFSSKTDSFIVPMIYKIITPYWAG